MRRLRQANGATLQVPANDYLCGALAIALCNWRNALVIENASASTTKRAPDLNLNALLRQ